MKLLPLGDSAIIVDLSDGQEAGTALAVRAWVEAIERNRLDGVTDVVPSYSTVAVFYDAALLPRHDDTGPRESVCRWLEQCAREVKPDAAVKGREVEIPVCYEGDFAPDLAVVAARAGLSTDEVVKLHSETVYDVRAVGFSPGFPYLGGLPERLHTPRRETPRTSVPAGSVGIGGGQTGIYSLTTPGGWNLIGRTPRLLFRPADDPPTLLQVGDRVAFARISIVDYEKWSEKP